MWGVTAAGMLPGPRPRPRNIRAPWRRLLAESNARELSPAGADTLSDLIRSHAARDPAHAALRQDGRELNYGALDALMDRVAAALQRDGLPPQDAIAILAGTSPDDG